MGTGRVLTGVGLAAVTAAIVVALLANTSNPPSGQSASPGLRVPAALAGAPLASALRGPAAVDQVGRLHGMRIDVTDAVVARYGALTLWISASPTPLKASALLWRMNRRMAGGTRVFSDPQPRELRGRTVFGTSGMGQAHAYYQSGAAVLWLAAPPAALDHALDELLAHYP
ncbi:MAG TPA: hypothetical protein VFW08_12375 [bacterium]|nr:hypothetical protein [bacterium]